MAAAGAVGRDLADPVGFRRFYERNLPRVYGYLLVRVAGARAIAEDLTQETFMSAVAEIRRGAAVDEPERWVMGIARHKLLDHYRRRGREERTLSLVMRVGRDDHVDPVLEASGKAMVALAELPAAQRGALVLRYLDGLSVPEVASVLRRSVHATESLLARGREGFRKNYGEGDDGQP